MSTALVKGGMAMMGAGGVGLGGWALSSHLKQEEDAIKTILKSKGHKLTSELPNFQKINGKRLGQKWPRLMFWKWMKIWE